MAPSPPRVRPLDLRDAKTWDASAFAATLDWRTSLIIVVGGDGTLNEVINGQTKIPMAMFPIGTGNAFAADQGIRGTLASLEALLRTGVVEWFDLGDAGGAEVHQHGLRCLRTAFTILRRRELPPVSVWCDGTVVTQTAWLVVVSNTRRYSPGISFTPLASPWDGCRLTGERVACHVDGEYIGLAPMTVSVLPSSVSMLVPASPRECATRN